MTHRTACPSLASSATDRLQHLVHLGTMQGVALHIRPVTSESLSAVQAHMLRLTETDRRLRFMRHMADQAVEAYVSAMVFDQVIRLGVWTERGTLIALVEGFPYTSAGTSTMELAFTTDPAWRRIGLAEALSHAVVVEAATRGVRQVVACCDARNASMRALLAAVHAEIEVDADEVNARWPRASANGCEAARAQ